MYVKTFNNNIQIFWTLRFVNHVFCLTCNKSYLLENFYDYWEKKSKKWQIFKKMTENDDLPKKMKKMMHWTACPLDRKLLLMHTIAAVAKVQVRLQKQVKGKWKIFGQSFYPQFSLHKKRYCLKMSSLKMFLIFLCVAFEIFEFEVLAITLYGNRTTIYGITSKVWSQLCPKLNMEIFSNFHCCCNLKWLLHLNNKIWLRDNQ